MGGFIVVGRSSSDGYQSDYISQAAMDFQYVRGSL